MTTTNTRPWKDFSTALEKHFGTAQRAQTNFCENTHYGLSTLQHWRKTNRVPLAAFDALKAIDATGCAKTVFRGYHTTKFTNRVIELSAEGKSLGEIASVLAAEHGRMVNDNMIKGIRFRNKKAISDKIAQADKSASA